MILQILSHAIVNLYSDGEKHSYSYKRWSILTLISSLLSPTISVFIITYTDYLGEGRIIGTMLASLISAIPIFAVILRSSKKLYDREIWRYILKRAIPLLPHYLSAAVILRVGEATVGRVFGTEALGKYSVALSLGLSLSVVTGGLISAVGPWVLRKLKKNEITPIKEILLIATRTLSLFSLLVLAFAPEAVKILTPREYHDCLIAIYPLSLSMIPSFLSSVLTQGEMYYSKSMIMNLPTVTAAAVSTILSLLILPLIDYRFVSLFVLLSYGVMLIINVNVFKKVSGEWPIYCEHTSIVFAVAMLYAAILSSVSGSFTARVIMALPLVPLLLLEAKHAYSLVREK
jgi:O-antigen/teichoic acid export membrane protein